MDSKDCVISIFRPRLGSYRFSPDFRITFDLPDMLAVDLEMNSSAVPSAVVTLGLIVGLGPKKSRSLNRVEGIITTVRYLQNQDLHPVATLSAL